MLREITLRGTMLPREHITLREHILLRENITTLRALILPRELMLRVAMASKGHTVREQRRLFRNLRKKLGKGAIIGICIGSVAVVAAIIAVCLFFFFRGAGGSNYEQR